MTDACGHETAPKPSKRQIAAALTAAEARSLKFGSRFTPLRRRAFELLMAAGRPVKAYDLIPQLKGAPTAPPTVYRTLETLVDVGLAHRIASLNAYVACQHGAEAHVPWFMICDCCGSVEEVARPTAEALKSVHGWGHFEIHALEAHGRCERCA